MKSSRTNARIKRRALLNSVLMIILDLIQLSDNDLEKIPLQTLMNIKVSFENFKKWSRVGERYMHGTYICPSHLDDTD